MIDIIDQFYQQTFSQAEARRRISILEQAIEQAVYTQGAQITLEAAIQAHSSVESDTQVLIAFVRHASLPKDSSEIKKMISNLRDSVLTRPVVVLAVPFEPTTEQVAEYGKWFRTNVKEDILLNINFDASVVGGCSITWQGKQVTYDLEYLIKQKRKEIVNVVDQFVEKKKKEVVI